MRPFNKLADRKYIEETIISLKQNGIQAFLVKNGEEAKKKALEIIPKGSEVMNMSSKTLEDIRLTDEILNSGRFDSVKKRLLSMNKETEGREMRKLGAAPDWAVGSVHAVTKDGKILIASQSGSQLAAYSYGAGNILWVAGAQKIVENIDEGIKRIYEYCLPLEDQRALRAYGKGSGVNKILRINKEGNPKRATMILVEEVLGF